MAVKISDMTGGATWSTPYIHPYLVNIVCKFESNPLKTLGEIAISDGRTPDAGHCAMTKAHLAFGRMS